MQSFQFRTVLTIQMHRYMHIYFVYIYYVAERISNFSLSVCRGI